MRERDDTHSLTHALALVFRTSKGAEEAFKRLSDAYVCLSDESSQRSYIRSLLTTTRKSTPAVPPPRSAPPAYPRKRRKKTRDEAKPPPPGPPPPPRRQRTPEEIWRAFQEEEERLARQEFLAKGFERTFASSPTGPQEDDGASSNSRRSDEDAHVQTTAEESVVNASGLDDRAQSWTRWQKQRESSPSVDTRRTVDAPAAVAADVEEAGESVGSCKSALASGDPICCLLCRRKFPTYDALNRHETLSKLHRDNLERLASA